MKVAIIGSGLSGLACAHELERHGIFPDIYEQMPFIGESLDFPAVILSIFNTPIKNPLKYLEKKYKINIHPRYDLKEITMIGPSKKCNVKGNLGYILRRGYEKDCVSNQMVPDIKSMVRFDTYADINKLKYEYDNVVLATGDTEITGKLDTFTETFNAYARVATIRGNFRTDSITVWFNTDYAKHGFGYLVPDKDTIGKLILIVDDPSSVTDKVNYLEFEKCWNKFIKMNQLNYEIIDSKDVHHRIGRLKSNKVENVYYAGLAGGFIDSILGFGSVKSILSGAAAGKCIAEGIDYDKFVKKTIIDIKQKHEFRKAYNNFNNNDIDKLIMTLGMPGIKQAVYNNPLFHVTYGAPVVKLFNFLKGNK